MTDTTADTDAGAAPAPDALEAKARRMGWKPEDEWQGDPPKDGFRTAEEFVARGDADLPILRERNKKLGADLAQTTARLDEMSGTLTEFKAHHAKTEERAYVRAKKELQGQQRQAVEDSDDKAFDAATKKIDDLEDEATKAREAAAAKPKAEPATDAVFEAWTAKNDWYGDDMELTAYADTIASHVSKKTGAVGKAYYDAVAGEVQKRFPDRFRNTNRDEAQAVESGGRMRSIRAMNGKGYSDLPADAKEACDRFVKQKLMTKAEYVAEYFAED